MSLNLSAASVVAEPVVSRGEGDAVVPLKRGKVSAEGVGRTRVRRLGKRGVNTSVQRVSATSRWVGVDV